MTREQRVRRLSKKKAIVTLAALGNLQVRVEYVLECRKSEIPFNEENLFHDMDNGLKHISLGDRELKYKSNVKFIRSVIEALKESKTFDDEDVEMVRQQFRSARKCLKYGPPKPIRVAGILDATQLNFSRAEVARAQFLLKMGHEGEGKALVTRIRKRILMNFDPNRHGADALLKIMRQNEIDLDPEHLFAILGEFGLGIPSLLAEIWLEIKGCKPMWELRLQRILMMHHIQNAKVNLAYMMVIVRKGHAVPDVCVNDVSHSLDIINTCGTKVLTQQSRQAFRYRMKSLKLLAEQMRLPNNLGALRRFKKEFNDVLQSKGAELKIGKGFYAHEDCPGYADHEKNIVTGFRKTDNFLSFMRVKRFKRVCPGCQQKVWVMLVDSGRSHLVSRKRRLEEKWKAVLVHADLVQTAGKNDEAQDLILRIRRDFIAQSKRAFPGSDAILSILRDEINGLSPQCLEKIISLAPEDL